MGKPTLILLILLCLSLIIGTADSTYAYASDNALPSLEQHFFFQTYNSEDLEKRLTRLEKRVFGEPMQGSTDERLARLSTAVPVPAIAQETTASHSQPSQTQYSKNAAQSVKAEPASAKSAPAKGNTLATAVPANPNNLPTSSSTDATAGSTAAPQTQISQDSVASIRLAVQAAKEDEIRDLLAQGVEQWRKKHAPEATEIFEQVVRLDPTNAEAHFSMGIIEESTGNLTDALASYKQASKFHPDNQDYVDTVATVERKLESSNQINDRINNKNAELKKLADDATAAYKRGEYNSSLDLFKQLDAKAPHQHLVKYNIGSVYLAMKAPDSALDYYKQALKLNPQESKYKQVVQRLEEVMDKRKAQEKASEEQYNNNGLPIAAPPGQNLLANIGLLGQNGQGGVLITTVGMESRAGKTGMHPGDVITAVDGTVVKNLHDINNILKRKDLNAPLSVMIQRGSQVGQLTL